MALGDRALLQSLADLLGRLRNTTSAIKKRSILKDAPGEAIGFLRRYLQLGPMHIGPAALARYQSRRRINETSTLNLEDLLCRLSRRELSGDAGAKAVCDYLASQPQEYSPLIMGLLERDLQVRISTAKLKELLEINQVEGWPGVALAETLNEEALESSLADGHKWWVSRKLDGVRGLARVREGKVELWSRTQTALEGPHVEGVKAALSSLPDCWLDGELVWLADDRESFKETMQRVRRKQELAGEDGLGSLWFLTFDRLDRPELPFRQRLESLHSLAMQKPVAILPQTQLNSSEDLASLWRVAQANAWEGLMLRRDAPHRAKRSSDLLKIKAWQDAEYRIVDYTLTRIRTIENGQERLEEGLLGAIIIKHRGCSVQVGSGFTLAERRNLAKLGSDLIGRLATVAYFGETTTDGRHSLRFPIFKALHEHGHRSL